MNDNNQVPQQPNPTLPTKDIFSSQTNNIPSSASGPGLTVGDKEKIISTVGGGRKFSGKMIVIFLVIIVLLLVLAVIAKTLIERTSGSKETKIVWWSLEYDEAVVRPIIDEYKQKNPNVTIEFVQQSEQDYRQRLTNALAKGSGPDIFEFHNSWVPMLEASLSPIVEDFSSVFYPVVTGDLKSSKGFLGVPLEYDGIALFINQDIFATYGKSAPKTWDDLRSLAQAVTVRDSGTAVVRQSGVALGVTSNIDYWQDVLATLFLQNGADLNKPASVNGQSALTYYANFSKVDRLWDETLPNSTTQFINGKLAMYFGTYKEVANIKRQNPNLRFAVVPLPQLPSASSTIPSVAYASYWVSGVSKKTSNSDVAWDFLKFMVTAESLQKLYQNEISINGYGHLYPRVDMQSELLSDIYAGPFLYQAGFAKSGYLYDKTFDESGINSQVGKAYGDAITLVNANSQAESALVGAQSALIQVLAGYGLVAAPVPTK